MGLERAPERNPVLEPTPYELRNRLQVPTTQAAIQRGVQEWMTHPGKAMNKLYGDGMIQKLLGFRIQAIPAVDGAYATLKPSLGESEHLDRICEYLKAPPPAFRDEPVPDEHPYLRYTALKPRERDPEDPPEPIDQYTIKNETVLGDIRYLTDLQQAFPPLSAQHKALGTLIDQLNAYRLLDPRIAMREEMYRTEGGRSAMDIGGMEMGRVGLTAILATATAIFGTISIVQFIRSGGKEISLAPLLWGFATWFVADPNLMNSFFDKSDPIKRDLEEIRGVTNNRTMQYLSEKHRIGGPRWARVVEGIYEGEHGNLHKTESPADTYKQRVAKDLAGTDVEVQAELLAMMEANDGKGTSDFAYFTKTLLEVRREDAKEFMSTYVKTDSFREGIRLDPKARRDIDELRKAREMLRTA